MVKQTVTQRDFSYGAALPEIIEGDDLELRSQSLRDAKNLRITSGRTARQRMGTINLRAYRTGTEQTFEMRPPNAARFGVIVGDDYLLIINENYEDVTSFDQVPWSSAGEVWAADFGDFLVLGPKFYALEYKEGEWTFGEMVFADAARGGLALPFWAFDPGTTIQPSALTGAVTVTASSPIFSANYEGIRLRYAERQMIVTRYINPTTVEADVVDELPPTFRITLPDVDGFLVGQVVNSTERNWSGIVVDIDGVDLICVTIREFDGPLTSEEISNPNYSRSPTAVVKLTEPRATTIWDEQLFSDARGWPRSGTSVNGRLALCDFPAIPNLIAISSSRAFNDFLVGLEDDDAIVRQAGNNNPRFLHIVAAVDLLLLSDRGCYYVKTRDGEVLSPANFQAVQFDQRGCNEVKPAMVDSGVVFVEKAGNAISACFLSGNVYLNWTVVNISQYHHQLFSASVGICGSVEATDLSEKYLLVLEGDGSVVAMSWNTDLDQERAGFIPWLFDGSAKAVFPLFDAYHMKIERAPGQIQMERFDPSAFMDSTVITSGEINGQTLQTDAGQEITTDGGVALFVQDPKGAHLAGMTVKIWRDLETITTRELDQVGEMANPPDVVGEFHMGLAFRPSLKPWPREVLESPRLGMLKARVIRFSVGVRNTVAFLVRRNETTTAIPARGPADSPGLAPPLKNDVYRFNIFGNRAHPDMEIFAEEPGPFEITTITQEVQA